jgi:Signal transduction histidine kinase
MMFKQLQRKLSLTYSLTFFLTMAAILFLLFFLFKTMIYQSVRWQVDDLAHDQAIEFSETHRIEGGPYRHSLFLSAFISGKKQDIVYKGSLRNPLRNELTSRLKNGENTGLLSAKQSSGKTTLIIYALEPVRDDGKTSGYIVIAKEILKTHEQIEFWFKILFLLGIATAILSVIIAHFLAKRAVAPVKKNFERQRAFVADASHEMRTPLSVFSASLELFEAEEKGRLSASSRETLKDLKDEVGDMNHLINRLLTMAKADGTRAAKNRKDFPLSEAIHTMNGYYSQKAADEGKTFSAHFPKDELILQANPGEIKQLLTIFLDNAFRYTRKGDRIDLKIQVDKEKHRLCFSVDDTGVGIPEAARKHIFERFYRVDKGRSRQSGGSGLGLSIANEIVKAYKGTIHVEENNDGGTNFTVMLPVIK